MAYSERHCMLANPLVFCLSYIFNDLNPFLTYLFLKQIFYSDK